MAPRAWDDGEDPTTFGGGSTATEDGQTAELADLLLTTTLDVIRLRVLLEESDEVLWRAVGSRLEMFHEEIRRIPVEPTPRKRIGFRPPAKNVKKRR